MTSTAGAAPVAIKDVKDESGRRRGRTGYLLLLPAALWLGIFFVIPFYSLVATSLFDPSGSDSKGYEMTYHVANYVDAVQAYWQPLVRSIGYAAVATGPLLAEGTLTGDEASARAALAEKGRATFDVQVRFRRERDDVETAVATYVMALRS